MQEALLICIVKDVAAVEVNTGRAHDVGEVKLGVCTTNLRRRVLEI